jgi:hypothetical protein
MKNRTEIIIFAILVAFIAFRLYQKYIRKDSGQSSPGKKSGTSISSSKRDDDYEPYSKK